VTAPEAQAALDFEYAGISGTPAGGPFLDEATDRSSAQGDQIDQALQGTRV